MADALSSSVLQILLQNIIKQIAEEIRAQHGLQTQLARLERCVERMQSVLADLETRQFRNTVSETVRKHLREVADDAYNLLDESATEIKRRESIRMLRAFRNSMSVLNPRRALFRNHLVGRIKEIEDRLKDIVRDNELSPAPGRRYVHGGQSSSTGAILSTVQYSGVVHGREQETSSMAEWLTTDENVASVPSVLAIHAMCGMGKSTLAREVFDRVSGHYALQMWVPVSRGFNMEKLMMAMVVEFRRDMVPPNMELWNLLQLQDHLKSRLRGQKYLLVLDDYWYEDSFHWDFLHAALSVGAVGSRVLVTTRDVAVAKLVRPDHKIKLRGLSQDHCWSIFAENAFEDQRERSSYPQLVNIGYEIAAKCNGSPLAARILGSQLSMRRNSNEWQEVLKSNFSGEAFQALQISYNLLHSELKDCLRFCSIFPKGFRFRTKELVLLWMAQNLIQKQDSQKMEDAGFKCFDRLFQYSFFEVSPNDPDTYIMHDLFHDMSQELSRGECAIIEHGKENFHHKVRHLSIFCNSPSSSSHDPSSLSKSQCLKSAYRHNNLYTLIVLNCTNQCFTKPPDRLHKHYSHLRALDLSSSNLRSLEQDISNLKFLRYLNLSNTKIESLPNSLNDLLNLQSLLLRNCYELKTLPQSMRNMCSLRHFDLHLDTVFAKMHSGNLQDVDAGGVIPVFLPDDISRLTQLQTLSRFVLKKKKKKNYCGITNLKNLNELQGDLLIANLQAITETEEAASAKLDHKIHVNRLKLQWTAENASVADAVVEDILEQLKPSSQLEELWIDGYSGIFLPSWVDSLHLLKLLCLTLTRCKRLKWIPALGQLQFLKELHIQGLHSIENLDCQFCSKDGTNFPFLRKVVIEDMSIFKRWYGEEHCKAPALRELVIRNCPELILLSHNFPSLHMMLIEGCPKIESLSGFSALQFLDVKSSGEWIWGEYWPFFNSLISLNVSDFSEVDPAISLDGYTQMERLQISHSDNLKYLPDRWLPTKLKHLSIKSCSQLQMLGLGGLSQLEEMEIQNCKKLSSLPSEVANLDKLEFLAISDCPMVSFPRDGLPLICIDDENRCSCCRTTCNLRGWRRLRRRCCY